MATNPLGRNHRRRFAAAALVLGAAVLAGRPAADARPTGDGALTFVASQSGVPVPGEFKKFSADIDFDPAKPAAGKVNVVVDLASVATGSGDADAMLKSKDFFDAGDFPQARFASTSIAADGAGKFRAAGQFTLKGRSLALAVPFAVQPSADGYWIEGSVPVSRLAYQIGQGEWSDTGTLSDQVLIKFRLFVPH